MKTSRLTVGQALIRFLRNQVVDRGGRETPFFEGVWGIFGHGNLTGVGQALQQESGLPYLLARNEQAMVHCSIAFAKMHNRLKTFACTSSIGPGATNMVTGAATATINRLPVLLLPADTFARRNVSPVLQQLESENSQDVSVNDALKPVSRFWDRINRPDQLPSSMLEAMRVLTSPAETGAVTLCLPQDVQTEAWDYPEELFKRRIWHIQRAACDRALLAQAMSWLSSSKRPLVIVGGGAIYSEAGPVLSRFCAKTGVPVCETQAGKGTLAWDHPQQLGAVGATGGLAANRYAAKADLILAVGTRLSDFTTASKTLFQEPQARFVGINVKEIDAFKLSALPLVGDARATLEELSQTSYSVPDQTRQEVSRLQSVWQAEVDRLIKSSSGPLLTQAEVIGAINRFSGPKDVVVGAAGSLPGDLHKLWRTRDSKGYHLEYGNSCMGYEIAGGLGVKMADPSREVYVLVGDGSYLMLSAEIVTSIQEAHPLNIVVFDNQGFASIGALSKSLGSEGFGTDYRLRGESGQLDGDTLGVDFASNAASLGANSFRASTLDELSAALKETRGKDRTTVIVVAVDKETTVPGYESWWDVPVAEVSSMDAVQRARQDYEKRSKSKRLFL